MPAWARPTGTEGDFWAGTGFSIAGLGDLACLTTGLACAVDAGAGLLPSQLYQRYVNNPLAISPGSQEYQGGQAFGAFLASVIPVGEAADAATAATAADTATAEAAPAVARYSVDGSGTATDLNGVRPPGPYARPSGATTAAQRASVQCLPCVDCGTTAATQVADHIDPLVQEYYRTGSIDLVRMRSLDAVQPQCPTCSASQGWWLSQFSQAMRRVWGF